MEIFNKLKQLFNFQMSYAARLILACAGSLLIFAVILFIYMSSSPMDEESVLFTVAKGSSLRQNANELKSKGIIRSSDFFVAMSYITGTRSIRSGRYRIYSSDSVARILKKIHSGEVVTARVTIPEGYSVAQAADAMEQAGICKASDFVKYSRDRAFLASIGINADRAEGYLFPETYVIAQDSDARDVITIMKKKMDSVLASLNWKERPGFSTHQMLTLASIIEKEAKVKDEQKKVSSVFHNRLKQNMPLQSCATVLYALNRTIPHLLLRDLEVDSPYNTYKHQGLTPTPIASPGKGAIEAAIYPDSTEYLFFVSRNDGSHYFSKDYSRHCRAQDYYVEKKQNGFVDDQK